MYYSNSNMYEGEWKKDARDGYGELFYSDGGYYKGFWRDDKRNGYGDRQILPNGIAPTMV